MKTKILISILITLIVTAFYKIQVKDTLHIGKSTWPGWDLFEYSQKKK